MSWSRLVVVGVAVGLATTAPACTPKPGKSCRMETKEVCVDEKSALVCHGGTWKPMACLGPHGCQENGCDQSVAAPNDVCNLPDDYACTADKKAMLTCTKNEWTLAQTCLGEGGCVMEKRKVTCDNSVAELGDPCREEEDYACSTDKKAALVCRQQAFVQASPCKGPKGCRVTGSKEEGFKVECDDSIASPGDACEKEGQYSCSADERAILKCSSKTFALEERCRAKEKCQIRGGQVGCY